MTRAPRPPARRIPWIVVLPFAISGMIHLVKPGTFERIIPRPLRRWKRGLVMWSGVAELVLAAGLLRPSTRAMSGLASAGLLLSVWPANVQMSVGFGRRALRRRDAAATLAFLGTLARLPLQVPLIRAALSAR